jgi:4-amino-4-deoxychorismate lyase
MTAPIDRDGPRPLVAVLGVGVIEDGDRAVAADDLGLTRGDGCFDATRLVVDTAGRTRLDHLDAHLARFARSAAALDLPLDEPSWRELIGKATAAWTHPGESVLRVILTRGREVAPAAPVTGLLTIVPLDERTIRARSGITVATLSRGHAADAFTDVPWLLGGVKTLSYAVNIAAGREAARRGVDDVLFVSTDGYVLEGPRSAFIWRKGDRLGTTQPVGTGVLASISQAAVFRGAGADDVETGYGLLPVEAVPDLDGAWLVSSGRLVAPVVEVDGRALSVDGEWTDSLMRWVTG